MHVPKTNYPPKIPSLARFFFSREPNKKQTIRTKTEQNELKRRAWERGRESSKLDMSFFPITERARGPPPPSQQLPTAAPPSPSHNNADLLGIDFDGGGDGEATAAAAAEEEAEAGGSGDGGVGSGGGVAAVATKGVGEGVVFEGLTLPGVVHEETRTVDTENASVEASIKVRGAGRRGGRYFLFFVHVMFSPVRSERWETSRIKWCVKPAL